MTYPTIKKAAGKQAAITITQTVTAAELQEERELLSHQINTDAFSIEAIGHLLATHDHDCGMPDDTMRAVGWLLTNLGNSIVNSQNEITRLEHKLSVANSGQEVS